MKRLYDFLIFQWYKLRATWIIRKAAKQVGISDYKISFMSFNEYNRLIDKLSSQQKTLSHYNITDSKRTLH
jgi:hypothetical protein